MTLKSVLQKKIINEWYLLALVASVLSAAVLVTMSGLDMSGAEQVSAMIAYSVRWSVPWLYLAFAASSLQLLFANDLTRWLLRNRKIMGLSFAVGMGWQVTFILWLVLGHTDYYVDEVYVLRDAIEGVVGYAFLAAMTVTSFKKTRAMMRPGHWKKLHTWGIYFLWAYAFSVYWHNLFYYPGLEWNYQPDWVDYVYYAGGLLAISARIAAWSKKELQKAAKQQRLAASGGGLLILAVVLMVLGGVGTVAGTLWGLMAYEYLWDTMIFQPLELYVPYWPFIPYLPLFLLMLGAALRVRALRTAA